MPRLADASGYRSMVEQLDGTMFALTPPPRIEIPDAFGERERVTLRLYADAKGRIPDEAAADLGRDFSVIRPACSVLHVLHYLRETGAMRRGRLKPGKELVITPLGQAVLEQLDRERSTKGAA